ncbi:hypothetical protein OQA88_3661 [Cercophora sp. LCS_1]
MGKVKTGLVALAKAVDPALDALFSTSSGPVTVPPKERYVELVARKPRDEPEIDEDGEEDEDADSESGDDLEEGTDEDGSVGDQESSDEESESDNASEASSADDEEEAAKVLEAIVSRGAGSEDDGRKRKRKQRDEYDNLESKYLHRLAEEQEPSGKRRRADESTVDGAEDAKADEASQDEAEDEDLSMDDAAPVHESLAADPAADEVEKASRTVFLSNVSAEAITSRTAKKILMNHMSSILDKKASPPQKIESIRFRSTAFSTAAIPKRAAFIKKSVMEATTRSTNAYVVYSSAPAARLAVAELNGTIVLDRHLRVDSIAHPAAVDHKRCVFVGNLGFVDDESILNKKLDEEGNEVVEKKKRTKVPMDVEEGLWRVFGKEAGKVESVRVVRDPVTRVGKGIAYVQFYDANAVESAVLLNGKKFPPMLPRELRVSRCKAPHKTARAMEAKHGKNAAPAGKGKPEKKKGNGYVPKATAEDKTMAGRAAKLLGKAAASQLTRGDKKKRRDGGKPRRESTADTADEKETKVMKSPEDIVLEGRRASAKDGRPKDLKFKGSGGKTKRPYHGKKKTTGRAAARAAKWKGRGGGK